MTSNLIAFSFLIFLTEVAGLTPLAAGTVLLIGKIWDAVNDPIVGLLSDRTRSRWGRRYPWMFLGTIPFGLTFFMMWVVPGLDGTSARFWYYVLASILFQVFFTVVNLPYTTLTAELTQDYDERTELTSFRLAFSVGGAILALALGLGVTQFISNEQQQYWMIGGICALFSVAPMLWCIFGTYGYAQRKLARRPALTQEVGMPFTQQLRVVLSNRAFWFVVGLYLCAWMALQITASILPFYVTEWMGLESYFLAALLVQGTAVIFMFICNRISQRVGKQGLFFIGIGVWLLVQLALFFLQPGQTAFMYGLCVIASFGVATAYVVPWAMLPDVIELDELQTGYRREGIFYSFMTLLQKLGLALGLFLVGAALEVSGFVADAAQQPQSALWAIRFFMGPVPMLLLMAGMVLCYFYPINRTAHAELLLKLAERRSD